MHPDDFDQRAWDARFQPPPPLGGSAGDQIATLHASENMVRAVRSTHQGEAAVVEAADALLEALAHREAEIRAQAGLDAPEQPA